MVHVHWFVVFVPGSVHLPDSLLWPPPPLETGHIVAGLAIYARSTLAQTGVSGPVVVDGESFLDALFASAGQG